MPTLEFKEFSIKPELVGRAGYPLERHTLTAIDGYITTIFRLPNINYPHSNGQPVFIQHGILSNSANFITHGNVSLAYVLWNAGYDVWIGNFRGSYYSEGHVNLTTYDKEYWDHSIDEMALYDTPEAMSYMTSITGKSLFYIGHSLGTTIGMMYASEFPEEAARNIKLFVFMAPAYTLTNMISPYKQVAYTLPFFLKLANDFDLIRLISQSQPLRWMSEIVCLESPVLIQLCAQLHNLFYGPITGVGSEKVPVYYNVVPGGTSLKALTQASALVKGEFRKFDYGIKKNPEVYGTLQPPEYDIKKILVPTYVMYGQNDWVVGRKDSLNFYNNLSPIARYGIREINDGDFNHLDFVYGRRVKEYAYDRIIQLFQTFPNSK
ncbi:lysosomal acid lipase/cholesteryl ester hydrolase-like isoform X2 [Onthophagus taurus]|uniref:lysosomal acid lipase/cholesteryl ester hydrolase-like isoform X2 n=1 Tax=Onthophagus taurus TaxID=166361 RepID=UPI000C20653F|nr:lysosomal acid lipase/cholesteryl ester hydrolase-like isoform X2 [Onthophagus taurus]